MSAGRVFASNIIAMVRDATSVLAGILIAFGLDAWWGHVQQHPDRAPLPR